jgi:hypothetical protein
VIEQQPQALVVIVAEPGQIRVVVAGHRAALQQQPRDRRVGCAGHCAAQRRPVTGSASLPGSGIGPRVQEQPGHGQQPVRPGRVETMPP